MSCRRRALRTSVSLLMFVPFCQVFACGSEADSAPSFRPDPPQLLGPGSSVPMGFTPESDQATTSSTEPGNTAIGAAVEDTAGVAVPLAMPTTPGQQQDSAEGGSWQAPPLDPNTPVGLHGQLRVQGQNLVNESGQPVQLEGVSSMWLNWESRFSQSKQGLQWLRDNWNMTLYRVAVGVEPDNAYLADPDTMMQRMRTAVRNAIDLGLYVIIDWHAHEAHESPEAAEEFFRQVAQEFGQYPHVLYETFNEPLGNHDWSNTIKPYHERIIPVIRQEDPDSVIILGNRQWDQRPDEAAADPVDFDNLMYTVHFYACEHRDAIRASAEQAYNAGLALFVTEWGATPADGGVAEPIVCAEPAQAWHDWMDERNIGSAAWKFDTCSDSSCFFNNPNTPVDGGWTDEWLTDHARFIRDRLLD